MDKALDVGVWLFTDVRVSRFFVISAWVLFAITVLRYVG